MPRTISVIPALSALMRSANVPVSVVRCGLAVALLAVLMAFDQDSLQAQQVAEPSTSIRVAVYEAKGVSDSVSEVLKDLKADTAIEVARISTDQILTDELNSFDVVIFSGGSGGAQGKSLGADGREKVRSFIEDGGGYIGICAGAYLASTDYDWSLHILDAKVLDRNHWARGFGDVELKVNASGRDSLSLPSDRTTVYYHQGPILAPAENSELDDYEEWASFTTEVKKEGVPGGIMPGKTAIAAGRFGDGRVLAISPHPERTTGLDSVVPAAVRWAAARRSEKPDLIIFQQGDLPVVISAPHGGSLQFPGVEPRKGEGMETGAAGFRVVRDGGTEELALEVARQLAVRMQGTPSYVISRVHRRYVDFNRPPDIAVEDPQARVVYDQYHAALREAVRAIREKHPSGLLIDIHGQGSSAATAYRGTNNGLTVSGMKLKHGEPFLHGPTSLPGLLKKHGWTVHPDPFDGKEQAGFTGGYIVKTYGSHHPDGIEAMQWELGADYRKTAVRERVAKELADSIAEYFDAVRAPGLTDQ
ncbi:MAG: ThuA domain-containing protein [Fuerstia sp.]|nr:ThuA domain-containing protein [Fuerstiella sp.]